MPLSSQPSISPELPYSSCRAPPTPLFSCWKWVKGCSDILDLAENRKSAKSGALSTAAFSWTGAPSSSLPLATHFFGSTCSENVRDVAASYVSKAVNIFR